MRIKNIALLVVCMFSVSSFFAQETIKAEKESLNSIPIGSKNGTVAYFSSEEGFFGPGSPEIDNEGNIWLFSVTNEFILKINGNKIETLEYPSTYPDAYRMGPNNWPSINQQGVFGFTDYPSNLILQLEKTTSLKKINTHEENLYFLPNGIAVEFSDYYNHSEIVSVEYSPNTYSMLSSIPRKFTARTSDETRDWLPTQPGGFSIGDDGLLYKNDILWSALRPDGGTYAYKYVGRLMSGHQIWVGGGQGDFIRYVTISNSKKQTELILELPWAPPQGKSGGFSAFNYGVGPWGELYCLISPFWDYSDSPWPPANSSSELCVVRNHLKYFGRLNDGGVRLRKEATTSSENLGSYPFKTGFRILETGTISETIGGLTNVWYKVRLLDGTEGWFFGAFVDNLYDGPGTNPPWPNVADW